MVRLACAFTGHRPRKFPWGYNEEDAGCKHLKTALRQEIALLAQNGYTDFLSGMAEGTDTWAALDVLELRETKLHCILHCRTQADQWTYPAKLCYRSILDQADASIDVSRDYSKSCMLERNRFLVDHAGLVLAVYNGEPCGGTAFTARYAQRTGKQVALIDPEIYRG